MADKNEFDEEFNLDNTDEGYDLENEFDENKNEPQPASSSRITSSLNTDVRKRIIFVAAAILAFLILYKFVGSFFSSSPTASDIQPSPQAQVTPQKPQAVVPPVVTVSPQLVNNTELNQLNEKASNLDQSQQTMRQDIDTVKGQVGDVATQVSNLQDQIAKLTSDINTLNQALLAQKQQAIRAPVHKAPVRRHHGPYRPAVTYFIKAIIPGRAWLMSSNGSTITVSEGSSVPGYGVVKLIDPDQGKVITSTGRTIQYNQSDT